MSLQFTRRQWAAAFAALPLLAQSPQPAAPSAAEDVEQARSRLKAASVELAAFAIPMNTEPAFQFKA